MGATVEVFTKQEFEEALPTECVPLGMVDGEYCYLLPATKKAGILIRSSVDRSQYSGGCGEDSIRAYPARIDCKEYAHPLGKVWQYRLQGNPEVRWLTRLPGWQNRLQELLKTMKASAEEAGECTVCGEPLKILKVKKEGPNKGRWFATCEREHNQFTWLKKL